MAEEPTVAPGAEAVDEKTAPATTADETNAPPTSGDEKNTPPKGAKEDTAKEGKAKGKAQKPKAKVQPQQQQDEGGRKRRGRSMRRLSKRHDANLKKVEAKKKYPIPDAIKLLKQVATGTKFDQTVNIVLNLGIDPKNADQMVRGAVSLPKGIGKKKRVIAFVDGDEAEEAKQAGAVEVGVDELIKKISDGWTDFDVAIAHPRTMGKVGKLGRVLGPQGKMPTPKSGTVTADVGTAVKEFAAGKIEFRNDAGANIHAIVGKVSFVESDLEENINAFIGQIRRMKPASSKGQYLKKVCISGTMSPGIELEVAQA